MKSSRFNIVVNKNENLKILQLNYYFGKFHESIFSEESERPYIQRDFSRMVMTTDESESLCCLGKRR